MNNAKNYDQNFYDDQVKGSHVSAIEVFKVLGKIYNPQSIVDTGCGVGTWLAAAEQLGATKLIGYDGDWVTLDMLQSENIDFRPMDLEKAQCFSEDRVDLAVSLEVAEHLDINCAKGFVERLCSISDVVMFSAAVRKQGGTNHINEQWQSYWAELFERYGYEPFDVIRPYIWNNDKVEWWYRQNILIYIKKGTKAVDVSAFEKAQRPILDLVHPVNYMGKLTGAKRSLLQRLRAKILG